MKEKKTIELGELFTPDEIGRVLAIYKETGGGIWFHERVLKEITKPAIPRINAKTGQENDARYWAYALEYACTEIAKGNT